MDGTEVGERPGDRRRTAHDRRSARPCRPQHRGARGRPAKDELALENNVAVAEIDVVREHLRVLLVSGEPHAGERTWRNVLKSDAAVDLVHFTILRPPEKQDGTPINELSLIAFPTRELFEEKIDEFDLIIFDRYQSRGVLPIVYYDNLAELRAERRRHPGGRRSGLCLPAASTARRSARCFRPCRPARSSSSPTRAISPVGMRHPVTRDLPGGIEQPAAWSQWFRLVDADAIAGDITMTGPNGRPLLRACARGRGPRRMLLSDQAWLWARGYQGGGPHAALLRRLVALADEGAGARGRGADRASEGRNLVVERQTLSETEPHVSVTDPTGKPETLKLRRPSPGSGAASSRTRRWACTAPRTGR